MFELIPIDKIYDKNMEYQQTQKFYLNDIRQSLIHMLAG